MKFRFGFVSNSSSSNFLVVFPRRPRNVKDVLQFMFDGKEGGVGLEYYSNGLSYNQVAQILWDDIKLKNAKVANLSVVTEALAGRYVYRADDNPFSCNGERDEDGGTWYYKRGRYFGSNPKIMEKIKKLVVAEDEKDKGFRARFKKIDDRFARKMGKAPQYAYEGGNNPYTNKPYTKAEIKKHKTYQKAKDEFHEKDKAYIALREEEMTSNRKHWAELHKIQSKIAKVDAKNFLDDNKGKFVFSVAYGDNDGEQQAIMEHGNVFRNVPNLKISNH